jgi:hypothetical protein
MEITALFGHALGCEYINVDNSILENYCYKKMSQHNANRSMGWQSHFIDLNDAPLNELVKEVNLRLELATETFKIKKEYAPKLTTGWININSPKGKILENNKQHLHPGKFLSFVYYVKATSNSGNLNLVSPTHDLLSYSIPNQVFEEYNTLNSLKWRVSPDSGLLVMFPGWVQHYADQNFGLTDRISLVFNADLQNLDTIITPEI